MTSAMITASRKRPVVECMTAPFGDMQQLHDPQAVCKAGAAVHLSSRRLRGDNLDGEQCDEFRAVVDCDRSARASALLHQQGRSNWTDSLSRLGRRSSTFMVVSRKDTASSGRGSRSCHVIAEAFVISMPRAAMSSEATIPSLSTIKSLVSSAHLLVIEWFV